MKNRQLRKLLTLMLVSTIFSSCGPSKKEIAEREAFVKDSTEKAEKAAKEKAEAEAERLRIHNEKIEVGKSLKREHLNEAIRELSDKLQQANKKLNGINAWQLGRSYDKKQTQLANQRMEIYEIEELIENVRKQISSTHLFESFEFQETPEGTVNHIFESAKTNDYSKMRHLIDPYGEFDNSALDMCYVEMLTSNYQNRWNETYEKGRIIGEPQYDETEERVKFEIATGWNSDRIVGIELVNRFGRWYIKDHGSFITFESEGAADETAAEAAEKAASEAVEEVTY